MILVLILVLVLLVITRAIKFTFPETAGSNFLGNVFVSYFLSCVERTIFAWCLPFDI